jgi:hypothetical protein
MAGLAIMYGGPKKSVGEEKPAAEGEPVSGKSAAAKAAFEAAKGEDVGEWEKALTAFVRACAQDKEDEY